MKASDDRSRRTMDLVQRLENDLIAAHVRWQIYLQIISRKRDRDLIDKYLGHLGFIIVELIIDDLFLRLPRITDRAESKNQGGTLENLTVRHVSDRVSEDFGSCRRLKWIDNHISDIDKLIGDMRRHRNKRLAHSDVKTRLGEADPLRQIPKRRIVMIFHRLEKIVQHLDSCIGRPPMSCSQVIIKGDGQSLIYQLRRLSAVDSIAATNESVLNAWDQLRQSHECEDTRWRRRRGGKFTR